MPGKKTLPDHSLQPIDIEAPFSDAFADELKSEFGIPENFNLTYRLNDEAYWYQWAVINSPPIMSEQKKLLEEVHKQAAALDELLCKLGVAELTRINDAIPGFSQFSYTQTVCNILELKHIAGMTLEEIPSKPGRRKDKVFKILVLHLHDIYRMAAGDDRKITYDEYASRYTGPAYEFVCKCLPVFDIHKSGHTIGSVIKEMVEAQGN
jgi:hypothetical protein